MPIVGARKTSQLEDVIAAAGFELSEAHRQQLDEVSRVSLGFPHDFSDNVRGIVYGDTVERIDLPLRARPGRRRDEPGPS